MADDFFRIIQLAGLTHLNEDNSFKKSDTPSQQQGSSDFKRKTVGSMKSRHNTQSNWAPEEEEDESDDSMVQEEGEIPSDDEFDMGGDVPEIESDDVTITLPRSCAEWLKTRLAGGMDNSEESGMVMDAIDSSLCGEEGCDDGMGEDNTDDIGSDLDVDSEVDEDMSMMASHALPVLGGLAHVAGAKAAQWMSDRNTRKDFEKNNKK
jgi:hypothetical protein